MPKDTTKKHDTLLELTQHYEMWNQDMQKRLTRKNGWNAITDAYYGKLPEDWPYITKIVDPRIRTSLVEKNARLLNSKLRGRLVPRESTDSVKAQINNAILDYQWDAANDGGSMMTKMSIMDMDTRLYGSKFALVSWKYEVDHDGEVVFDGNEMYPLDIRDCGMDPTASHIRDAKWFQVRTWEKFEDLESETDAKGSPLYKNLDKLRRKIKEQMGKKKSATRDTEYTPRVLHLRGLEDRTGEDMAYPVVLIVTEYREDRWITYAPDHNLILRDIDNPYDHGRIPIAQLRYYPSQDDAFGESEVEPVLPLWRAIQATICSYMDEVILKMRPPLKIIENAARVETIQYGPEAQWLVSRQDAIEEMRSSGDSLAYFQTTYQALISSFNIAMGDLSQGTSSFQPFESSEAKTATEIKATVRQQNTRDQKNQNDLAEFLKDMMMMWVSNNKQFLFSDPDQTHHIVKIVGRENYRYFKRAGLADMELPQENAQLIADIIEQNPDMSEMELLQLQETASIPAHPVVLNPKEKNPEKLEVVPKMQISEMEDSVDLAVTPDDLGGLYDYIPDVKSMAAGALNEMTDARQRAIDRFRDGGIIQLLAQEGYQPKIKALLEADLEGTGLTDAEQYFEKVQQDQPAQEGTQEIPGLGGNSQGSQLSGVPQAPITGGIPQ